MCRLCIVISVGCVVVVSLFIAAPIVYVGYVLSWALSVLLLFHCLLLLQVCVQVMFCPGVDCVVVVTLFIAAPIVYVGYVLSWAVIVLLLFQYLLLLPLCM